MNLVLLQVKMEDMILNFIKLDSFNYVMGMIEWYRLPNQTYLKSTQRVKRDRIIKAFAFFSLIFWHLLNALDVLQLPNLNQKSLLYM